MHCLKIEQIYAPARFLLAEGFHGFGCQLAGGDSLEILRVFEPHSVASATHGVIGARIRTFAPNWMFHRALDPSAHPLPRLAGRVKRR